MERVKEMYRLAQKHGLKLAGLRSFDHYVTPEMIAEKRRLADERRRALGMPLLEGDEEHVPAELAMHA
jgi:hypothetical protein